MKKLTIVSLLGMSICMISFAQRNAADYVKGEITPASGDKIICYIVYNEVNPGGMQGGVEYITEETYNILAGGTKIKGKDIVKLDPKEVTSVTLENGKSFKTMTYTDMTAVGAGTIPKKYIFEVLVDGKVSLFKKYPGGGVQVVSGDEAMDLTKEYTREEKIARANAKYEVLIIKDEKNPKSISNIKLDDYISDNESVYQRYQDKDYGNLKAVLGSKIKSGSFNENHPRYANDLIKCISDYNQQ
jgi:hypothetical protein